MKKRSLFAAVAMLIVSAIVLTSATYAWFATGSSVSVESVSASIANTDGSLQISADGLEWGPSVSLEQLRAVDANSITDTFAPISVDPTDLNMAAGSINNGVFKSATPTKGSYVYYTVYLRSDVDVDVNIGAAFNFGGVGYIYGLVKVGENDAVVHNIATNKYFPVRNSAGLQVTDTNGNSIIDDAEHDAYGANMSGLITKFDTVPENYLGSVVTPTNAAQEIHLTAGNQVSIVVMLWAEGQNTACRGSISANASAVLSIAKKGSST